VPEVGVGDRIAAALVGRPGNAGRHQYGVARGRAAVRLSSPAGERSCDDKSFQRTRN
jgi:hypothetical protein